MEVLLQAQKNKWASLWIEKWFYLKLEDVSGLCGDLAKIDYVVTDGCAAVVGALRVLSHLHFACDLVEEYVCAMYVPLRSNEAWFRVRDEKWYRLQGLKGLRFNFARGMEESYREE